MADEMRRTPVGSVAWPQCEYGLEARICHAIDWGHGMRHDQSQIASKDHAYRLTNQTNSFASTNTKQSGPQAATPAGE